MNLKKHFRTNSFWFMQMSVKNLFYQKIVDSPPMPLFVQKWRCIITWGSCHKRVFGLWYIKGWKLSDQTLVCNQCKKYAQICISIFHGKVQISAIEWTLTTVLTPKMKRSDIFTYEMICLKGIFFQILEQNENAQCTPSLGSSPPLTLKYPGSMSAKF